MSESIPVHAAYQAWAASYDSDVNATRDLDAQALAAIDLPLDGAAVVELGAGTGKNTGAIAARARSVLALDFSAAMLARARARVPCVHVRFVEHDITRPWPLRRCRRRAAHRGLPAHDDGVPRGRADPRLRSALAGRAG